MKILMLCPLISSSSFITVYPYASILSRHHEVKLVGPLLGKEPYIKDDKLDIDFLEPTIKSPIQLSFMDLYRKNKEYVKKQRFDALHCFKLLPHTSPVGVFAKKRLGRKFVLTIDDFDACSPKNPIKRLVLKWAEGSYRHADAITVSSFGLKRMYGGEVIYQVANENLFRSGRIRTKKFRKKYMLEGNKIIGHAGTLYDFKGIDVLIRAVKLIYREDLKLVVAGEPVNQLLKLAGKETIFTGRIPIKEAAELTSLCDVYAIPTKDTEYSRMEIPAKIFEPMMMGKPIVASSISDVPQILGNGKCGLLAKPGSVQDLADKIEYLLDNPEIGKKLGHKAKNMYEQKYNYKQKEKAINNVYSKL